jgi:hypothetical protein
MAEFPISSSFEASFEVCKGRLWERFGTFEVSEGWL